MQNPPLPSMEAPAAVDFISMDRVTQLYADLPTIFASDIARRQQAMASRQPSLAPSTSSSNLKRDRTEEVELNIANKRQNTGDNKSPPLRPPTVPPTPALMGSPAPPAASFPMSNNGSSGAMGNISQPPMQGMPSIAPPALPQGFTGLQPGQGATEAQVTAAAERDRARQQQIQDAIRRNQLQQQQQNNRQMSPPSNQGGAPSMPGQGQGQPRPGSGLPNIDFSSPRAVEHFGPNAVQNMQVLQTPTHAFTQYLHAKIPGFDSMPLPQQLQKMHQVQVRHPGSQKIFSDAHILIVDPPETARSTNAGRGPTTRSYAWSTSAAEPHAITTKQRHARPTIWRWSDVADFDGTATAAKWPIPASDERWGEHA